MSPTSAFGFPPPSVVRTLRLEGLAAFLAAVTAYGILGGNWWIFGLLLLAPDLSFLGYIAGERTGARIYNLAHTYAAPAIFGAIGWFGGIGWLVAVALIWIAH